MNATFLLLSTAWIASADAAPAPAMTPAPVVVTSTGCNGCGSVSAPSYSMASSCDSSPCGPRMGLFARLKAKLHSSRSHCHHSSCAAPTSCAPACAAPAPVACAAPAPCAPACGTPLISQPLFTGFTTSACGCGSSKIGLLDRLRAKFKHSSSCDACGSGSTSSQISMASSPCSVGPAMVAPAAPASPPKEMPAPAKEDPKKEDPKNKTTQAPDTLRIPELGSTAGKY